MALDPKMLKRFLDNPAHFSAEDMGLESGETLAPNESEDGALQIPEVEPEADLVEQAPEIADPDEVNQEADLEEDELASATPPELDTDIMKKLKHLKSGGKLDDELEEPAEEVAGNMQASMDMRKKAIQQIKQKYLGQ